MNIIILGAPASGKGTQAERLSKKLHLYHFQSGDLARELAARNKRLHDIVYSGKLVPEEEMSMYVVEYLSKNRRNMKNILFEGFPRFISQYKALEKFLLTEGDDIDAVVYLDVGKDEAVKRISSRRTCVKCGRVYNLITNPPPSKRCKCGGKLIQRKDDKPKAVKVRFKYYKENTKELIDYLRRKGTLIKINGERPIEIIFDDILKKLKKRGLYNG